MSFDKIFQTRMNSFFQRSINRFLISKDRVEMTIYDTLTGQKFQTSSVSTWLTQLFQSWKILLFEKFIRMILLSILESMKF